LTTGAWSGTATIRKDFRMRTHVALLRGNNVGGRNRSATADLRAVVTSLAHTEVATYIQSGNVVFRPVETDTAALATGWSVPSPGRRTKGELR
jgi:hypothetical protein